MEPVPATELVFLKITDENEGAALDDMLKDFQAIEDGRYAAVTVTYDAKPFAELWAAVDTSVATGIPIDLLQADGPVMKYYGYNGILIDLTDYFTPEEIAQWMPQSIEEGSIGGRLYGPPMRQSCSVMWGNLDMLDAAGVEFKAGEFDYYTYQVALDEIWQPLTLDENGDGSPEQFGVRQGQGAGSSHGDYHEGQMARSNGEPGSPTFAGMAEDGITFTGYTNTAEAVETYVFAQGLYNGFDGAPPVASKDAIQNAFLAGNTATVFFPDNIIGIRDAQFPDVNIDVTGHPFFTTPLCHTGSWHYGVSANTDEQDVASAYVRYFSSDAAAEKYFTYVTQMPANITVLNSAYYEEMPFSFVRDFFVEYGVPRRQTPAYNVYQQLFGEFYSAVVNDPTADAQALADDYAAQMDAAAAVYAGWNE